MRISQLAFSEKEMESIREPKRLEAVIKANIDREQYMKAFVAHCLRRVSLLKVDEWDDKQLSTFCNRYQVSPDAFDSYRTRLDGGFPVYRLDTTFLDFEKAGEDIKLHRLSVYEHDFTEVLKTSTFRNGRLHSYAKDAAISRIDGLQVFANGGLLHREDGAAILEPDGRQQFFFKGTKCENFLELTALSKSKTQLDFEEWERNYVEKRDDLKKGKEASLSMS